MEPLLVLHAAAALCAPWLVRRYGRGSFLLLAAAPAAGFCYALIGPQPSARPWAPAIGMSLAFRADELGLLMMLLVTGVGALVLVYSARYFSAGEAGLGRFGGVLTAFAGAMLGLVTADDLLLLYVFWELTTVCSYLLIGHEPENRASRRAGMQALIITTLGGLAMLAGFVMIGQAAGTYRISAILADPPQVAPVALVLVLVGALAKSAIFPFSSWLPAAMAAPTPVSAYLHAAAMVKAGVYLLARLGPAFGDATVWRAVAVPLGALTMLLGGWRALRETDLKKLLAYGTVSQLGFLIVLFGAGTGAAALAGVAMLLAHALFKASLFLVVGVVDHAAGRRDMRGLSGLARSLPWTCGAAVLAGMSMAGLPPLWGFVSKEAALDALLDDPVVLTAVVAGSALTAAYTLRFLWGAFGAKPGRRATQVKRQGVLMVGPTVLLAALGLVAAPFAGWYESVMASYTESFTEPGHGAHLAVWSGFGLPLLLSASALAAGVLLFVFREPVARLGVATHITDTGVAFWHALRRTDLLSLQLTGIIQRGSVPDYVMLTLLSLAGVGTLALSYGPPLSVHVPVTWWERAEQPLLAVLIVAAVVLALRAHSYLLLAICVGLTGYGVALLFLTHGSPDLALTQFLAETLSLVMFVLVLRRVSNLPVPARLPFGLRLGLGVVTGAVVTVAGVLAMDARTAQPVGDLMAGAAEEAGAGNIVSALLLDIRAWDTLGESTVIVVLTLGVTSLIYLRRTSYAIGRRPARERPGRPWLASALPEHDRALAFEVAARLTFHTVLLLSVFLLFVGHSQVGGGFSGGIVAGLAITVRYLAGGKDELARAVPMHPGVLLGCGLTLSVGTALAGLVFGGEALTMLSADLAVPLVGKLHLSTVLLFDLGIYLTVVGMVQDVLRALGAQLDEQIEAR